MDLKSRKSKKIGVLSLLVSRVSSGFTKPALKLLIMMGGPFGILLPNAISFCNVLFVGGICASIVPFFLGFRNIVSDFKKLSLRSGTILFFSIILNSLVPSLIFYALLKGNIINIIIVGRFRGLAIAFFGYLFFKRRISKSDIFGYLFIILGLLVLLFSEGLKNLGIGELLMFVSAIFAGLLNVADTKCLEVFSEFTYLFIVDFCSAVLFFIIVMMFYGFYHFADAFQGGLWLVMLLYGGVGVMSSQIFWLFGIQRVSSVIAGNVALITPLFTVLFAYLLLKAVPTMEQLISLAIIILGLFLAKLTSLIGRDYVKVIERPGTA